jgi:acyl-ACP thioesterase
MVICPKIKTQYKIMDRDSDFSKRLKIGSLFGYLQDAASMHSEHLGCGVDRLLRDFGVAWILMRLRIDIIRMPLLFEEITIETWPQEPKAVFERDYIVKDTRGDILINAVSMWVLMDMEKREITRNKLFDYGIPILKERAIDCRLGKLKPFDTPKFMCEKEIGYSDSDYNGHINNAMYANYIMDCLDADFLKTHEIKTISINYVNEILLGDTLLLRKDENICNPNLFYVEGVGEKEGKLAFQSIVEFY